MAEAELDQSMLDQIRDMDDEDQSLLKDIIQTYLDDAPKRIADIHAGLESKDWDQVHRAAHTLKGSSSNLGLLLLVQPATELVSDIRSERTDRLAELVDAIDETWPRAEELLKAQVA